MKITDQHKDYTANIAKWKRWRDAVAGEDAIKAGGVKYLAALPGQSTKEYDVYKGRALWYPATGRTQQGLSGLVFSKAPVIDAPTGAEAMLDDCNLMGKPFSAFTEDTFEEVLSLGRFGILVDFPVADEGTTMDEAEKLGLRPYVIAVEVEQVINWAYARISNRYKLARVVITECWVTPDGKEETQYRELILLEGVYHVQFWRKEAKTEEYVVVQDIIPTKDGAPLTEIPFWFAAPEFGDLEIDNSPLADLISLNISHYKTMADIEHAAYHCGLPTPVLAGNFGLEDGDTLKLGGNSGLRTTDPNAKWGYLEFTGQGIEPLEKRAAAKEAMMAKVGARMLAEDKKAAETAETMKIRTSGEASALASIANAVSATLTKVLEFMCEWAKLDSASVKVQLNTEYGPSSLSAQDLMALFTLVQGGELPRPDYFAILQKGGLIDGSRTYDDFVAETPEPGFNMAPAPGNGVVP